MRHFAHNIGDYAAATAHLSFIEDAAYHRCLRRYYQDERALPGDVNQVQRLVGARTKEERQAVANVLAEFFHLEEDGYHQSRADREIAVYHSKAKDGAKGAAARWGTPKEQAARNRSQRLATARAKAKHTKEEWAAVVEVFGAQCVKCRTPAADLIGGTICKDHVIGIRNGGDDGVWNLQPMCRPCNTAKGQDGDFRGNVWPDWRERLAKRLAKCVATTPHSPLTSSEANASGADAPQFDPVKALFDDGVKLLTEAGTPEKQARSLIGGWRKAHGDEATRTAIQAAYDHGALAPVEFIVASLTRAPKPHETWDQRRIREAMEAIQ